VYRRRRSASARPEVASHCAGRSSSAPEVIEQVSCLIFEGAMMAVRLAERYPPFPFCLIAQGRRASDRRL
jgi:hypothetical protein